MAKILSSPGKYVQGAGELKKLGTYAEGLGKNALILISKGGYKRIGKDIEKSFADADCTLYFDYFNGECKKNEINRLKKIMEEKAVTWSSVSAEARFLIPPKLPRIMRTRR